MESKGFFSSVQPLVGLSDFGNACVRFEPFRVALSEGEDTAGQQIPLNERGCSDARVRASTQLSAVKAGSSLMAFADVTGNLACPQLPSRTPA